MAAAAAAGEAGGGGGGGGGGGSAARGRPQSGPPPSHGRGRRRPGTNSPAPGPRSSRWSRRSAGPGGGGAWGPTPSGVAFTPVAWRPPGTSTGNPSAAASSSRLLGEGPDCAAAGLRAVLSRGGAAAAARDAQRGGESAAGADPGRQGRGLDWAERAKGSGIGGLRLVEP